MLLHCSSSGSRTGQQLLFYMHHRDPGAQWSADRTERMQASSKAAGEASCCPAWQVSLFDLPRQLSLCASTAHWELRFDIWNGTHVQVLP